MRREANRPRLQIAILGALTLLATLISAPTAVGAPPANDNFANATVFTPPTPPPPSTTSQIDQTTVEATAETGEPAHNGSPAVRSVWYSFTPSATGRYAIYTCPASARLAVYTGDALNALTPVASGNSGGTCGSFMAFRFVATAGTNYHLAVDSSSSENFSLGMELLKVPPGNDNFANATVVTPPSPPPPSTTSQNNQTADVATAEPGEPAHNGSPAAHSVWYSFTPSATGLYALYTCPASARLAVYTGDALNALTVVASGNSGGTCGSFMAFQFVATAGTDYHLAVDSSSSETFTLGLELLSLPDTDGDGVPDDDDSCPTQAGPASNGGCPVSATQPPTPTAPTTTPTTAPPPFDLAGAIKKCKKKFRPGKARSKCIKKAKARA